MKWPFRAGERELVLLTAQITTDADGDVVTLEGSPGITVEHPDVGEYIVRLPIGVPSRIVEFNVDVSSNDPVFVQKQWSSAEAGVAFGLLDASEGAFTAMEFEGRINVTVTCKVA